MNQLVEQCKNQADPEEVKKLQEEKKQLVTQQKSTTDEAHKLKVRVDAMRNEITRLQAEINVKKVCILYSGQRNCLVFWLMQKIAFSCS